MRVSWKNYPKVLWYETEQHIESEKGNASHHVYRDARDLNKPWVVEEKKAPSSKPWRK